MLSTTDLAIWIALVLLLAWTYLSAPSARRVTGAAAEEPAEKR